MSKPLTVFAVGSPVTLTKPSIEAAVSEVRIGTDDVVLYEVVYWDGSKRVREVVAARELTAVADTKQTRIGFIP